MIVSWEYKQLYDWLAGSLEGHETEVFRNRTSLETVISTAKHLKDAALVLLRLRTTRTRPCGFM